MITRAQRRERDAICHRRDCIRAGKRFDRLLLRLCLFIAAALLLMQWGGWLPGQ